MALTVGITGAENIEQGGTLSLTAVVAGPGTFEYAWRASRGSFIGATDEATAVYRADFTDPSSVDVTITCDVTRPANATPTSAGPSLTALAEIGVTGILVNMFLTDLGAVAASGNSVLYNETTGALASGSDQRLSSNVLIRQIRWDNQTGFNHFVLNNNEAGSIGDFFRNNNNQSVYLIFADGTYVELTPTDFANANSAGNTWARWEVTEANIRTLLNGLSTTSDLVVGVADAGSVGWDLDTGSDTATVTASVPVPLSIESINEQFITIGTEDYVLVIDITGNPDSVDVKGHMEGFFSDWDSAKGQLRIEADEVTRLITGVTWDLEVIKRAKILTPKIKYNVIPAAPILQTLPTIHLYRGVPINFDIIIANIPPLIIPNARLLGLKSELLEHGLNVRGMLPADATFSFNSGNVTIIIPSDTGETSEMHDYPYQIESGSPPAIGTPKFTPKGDFGELTLDDVNHALGYEWTLETGDDATWNFFNDARPLINPSTIEVTPGNLNVTITFPNVSGASSYAYMLESETSSSDWIQFTGTLSNGRITTIIPNLEEGVTYTLRLRVASPWEGPSVAVTVYGGRLVYALHEDNSGSDNHSLYVFHTGTAQGAVASLIKRILLPDDLDSPQDLAIDFENDDFYISDSQDRSVHVFPLNTAHDTEATRSRKFFAPTTLQGLYSLSFYDGTLYGTYFSGHWIESFAANTPNGQPATRINRYVTNIPGGGNSRTYAADATKDLLYYTNSSSVVTGHQIVAFPRTPVDYSDVDYTLNQRITTYVNLNDPVGLSIVGNVAYVSHISSSVQGIYLIDFTKTYTVSGHRDQIISSFTAPAGCSNVVGLVVER